MKWVKTELFLKKNGGQSKKSPEKHQVHETIKILETTRQEFIQKCISLYHKGHSTPQIAKLLRVGRSTVRDTLVKANVPIRNQYTNFKDLASKKNVKMKVAPFGFCYLQGSLVPNPNEHEAFLLIHQLWKSNTPPVQIVKTLNLKKLLTRHAKQWNRASVIRVIERFNDPSLRVYDDHYEIK